MPDSKKKILIFLSHASEDKPKVRRLCKRLKDDGFNPWLDEERLLPGQDWNLEIEKTLRTCDAILLCFSANSVQKQGYIQREYKRAMKHQEEKPEGAIFVIPVRLDECETPYFIQELHCVDYPEQYDRLVLALHQQMGKNDLSWVSETPSQEPTKRLNKASLIVSGPGQLQSMRAQEILRQADDAYNSCEFDKAIQLYMKVLDLEPKNQRIRKLLEKAKKIQIANEAYYSAEYDGAIQLYMQVLDLEPDNQHAQKQLEKAKKLFDADDAYYAAEYAEAIRLYMEVLDLESDNQHARDQLEKAELYRLSSQIKSELPREALQLYRQARSFIGAGGEGDLDHAHRLLEQAIDIATAVGIDFQEAKELISNLANALEAEKYKKKAFEELDTQQWARALEHLNSAYTFDPTDDTVKILISHLQSLIHAQHLVEEINAKIVGIIGRFNNIFEIREIIELTKETAALSTLWQNVVSKFGEGDRKRVLNRGSITISLFFIAFILLIAGFLYVFPRNRPIINCDQVIPGLLAHINYPVYNANGDEDKINITFINTSNIVIDGSMLVSIEGTANLHLIGPVKSNIIELKNLRPDGRESATIHYLVDEPFRLISDPGKYIDFSIRKANSAESCEPENLHIAMSPIPFMNTMWKWLFSSSGIATIATTFFWDQLIKLIRGKADKK